MKIVNMSLAAAVAIAGLSTTVSAKGVDELSSMWSIDGMARIRYDWSMQDDKTKNKDRIRYRVQLHNKFQLSDMVTLGVELQGEREPDTDAGSPYNHGDKDINPWTADEQRSLGLTTKIDSLYFSVKNLPMNSAVTFGRQPANHLLTNSALRVDGIIATASAGPVNLVGAFAFNHDEEAASGLAAAGLDGAETIVFAAYGAAGPLDYNLQFFNLGVGTVAGVSVPYIVMSDFQINRLIPNLGIQAQYGMGSVKTTDADLDVSFFGGKASYSIMNTKVYGGYSMANEDNGMATATAGANALINSEGYYGAGKHVAANGKVYEVGVEANFMGNGIGASYLGGTHGATDMKYSVLKVSASKTLSKALNTMVVYGMQDNDGMTDSMIRLQFMAKF